jgi:hypothetical protein
MFSPESVKPKLMYLKEEEANEDEGLLDGELQHSLYNMDTEHHVVIA